MTRSADEVERERRRVSLQEQARAADAREAFESRAEGLERAVQDLAARAHLSRRLLARLVAAGWWGRIASLRRMPSRRRSSFSPEVRRLRKRVFGLTRAERVYKAGARGALPRRRAGRRHLTRRARGGGEHIEVERLSDSLSQVRARWGSLAAGDVERAVAQAPTPLVLVGTPPLEASMKRALAAIGDEGSEMVGITSAGAEGAWCFDWRDGAPVPVPVEEARQAAAVGGDSLLIARSAIDPSRQASVDDPRAWGIETSLRIRSRGGSVTAIGATQAGPPDTASPAWWLECLDRMGAELTTNVLRDLAAGGGSWCPRTLGVCIGSGLPSQTSDAVLAAGWKLADEATADATLSADGSETLWLRLAWPGFAAPARLGGVSMVARAPEEAGPKLASAATVSFSRTSIALSVAAPDERSAARGGDIHLARALAIELGGRGLHAVVRTNRDEETPSGAAPRVRVGLRGRRLRPPRAGQTSILWLISHPAEVPDSEISPYDSVLAASADAAAGLQKRGYGARPLLQFAHPSMLNVDIDRRRSIDLAFVGNWRGQYRRVVWDAHCAGLRPTLVGEGWRHLAAADVLAEHVPHDELAGLYAEIRVLLVDHWDDMRVGGFISNRVFDALAAGCVVISDRVAGLDRELSEAVNTYERWDELPDRVAKAQADSLEIERSLARRSLVAKAHTVCHRADVLLDEISALLGAQESPC